MFLKLRKKFSNFLYTKKNLSSWLLEVLEEEEDREAVRAAREEGGKPIPWEQIKKEIHWDELLQH